MKIVFRLIVLIIVLFGIVGLAKNQVAWAANSSEQLNQSASPQIAESISQGKDDYCDKPRNKRKHECKDRDRDKHDCRRHPGKCGSVKPPSTQVLIPVTGEYSVGGFCTLSVGLIDPHVLLQASLQDPLPRDLPKEVHNVQQGCLVTYYRSGKLLQTLTPELGGTTICFAAVPDQETEVYFLTSMNIN